MGSFEILCQAHVGASDRLRVSDQLGDGHRWMVVVGHLAGEGLDELAIAVPWLDPVSLLERFQDCDYQGVAAVCIGGEVAREDRRDVLATRQRSGNFLDESARPWEPPDVSVDAHERRCEAASATARSRTHPCGVSSTTS